MRPYSTIEAVVDDFARWRLMSERLSAGQMPPATMPQPPAALREQVLDWIQAVGINEARKHAGDPGRVLARRLSNAEYNYTIRDLTGVDIQPAREFPVDPANTEGFDNSGESLTMSPSLFNKYLQAARQVGEHMLLTPDGSTLLRTRCWWRPIAISYSINRILDFYARQPTDEAAYFEAAWRYRHRAALGQAAGIRSRTSPLKAKVSAKYLAMIWQPPRGAD